MSSDVVVGTFLPNRTGKSLRRVGILLRCFAWEHRPKRDLLEQRHPQGVIKMELSAPTKIVFILAVVLVAVSLLPVMGVAVAVLGVYSYWLLLAAFVVLAAGNLVTGL